MMNRLKTISVSLMLVGTLLGSMSVAGANVLLASGWKTYPVCTTLPCPDGAKEYKASTEHWFSPFFLEKDVKPGTKESSWSVVANCTKCGGITNGQDKCPVCGKPQ